MYINININIKIYKYILIYIYIYYISYIIYKGPALGPSTKWSIQNIFTFFGAGGGVGGGGRGAKKSENILN